MAAPRRHGPAGRHAQGRGQPPGAVGRGCGGAQPARLVGQGARLFDLHRRHRQSVRAPRGQRCRRTAGDERLAHGQPADRRPLRRHVRRAGGLRGAGSARGRGREDQAAGRGRRLDQRGRLALPAGRHGLGGVRGPLQARRHAFSQGLGRRRAQGRAGRARSRPRRRRCSAGKPGFALDGYVEAHIEQGPRLENERKTIGVVTGIQGSRRYIVETAGEEAHAGTTPRAARKDAFAAATRIAAAMYEATTDADDTLRFTIGRVDVQPGSPNTVPGKASFTIDMRHPSDAVLEAHEAKLRGDRGQPRRALQRQDRARDQRRADRLRSQGDRPGARQGPGAEAYQHGHAVGRGPRRHAHRETLPRRHDLRALRARHQPQRGGERHARRPRRRRARAGRGAGRIGQSY